MTINKDHSKVRNNQKWCNSDHIRRNYVIVRKSRITEIFLTIPLTSPHSKVPVAVSRDIVMTKC
jgi:hypothetical protein